MSPRRSAAPLLALTLGATLGLSGCASDVVLNPAPYASAELCAEVLLAAPRSLGGAERRTTTSQASLAWGDPAITLRCGVPPLPPTPERCVAITDEDGLGIDWIVHEDDPAGSTSADGRGRFAFTTWGRVPAVEVVVPVEYAGSDATGILLDLAPAIEKTTQERSCLDDTDSPLE